MDELDDAAATAVQGVFAAHGISEFVLSRSHDPFEAVFLIGLADYARIDERAVTRELAAAFGGTTKVAVAPDRVPPATVIIPRPPRS